MLLLLKNLFGKLVLTLQLCLIPLILLWGIEKKCFYLNSFRAFQTAHLVEALAPIFKNMVGPRSVPDGRFGLRRKWLAASKYRTRSSSIRTRNRPCAIFAANYWRASSSRASSAETAGSTSIESAKIIFRITALAKRPKSQEVCS